MDGPAGSAEAGTPHVVRPGGPTAPAPSQAEEADAMLRRRTGR